MEIGEGFQFRNGEINASIRRRSVFPGTDDNMSDETGVVIIPYPWAALGRLVHAIVQLQLMSISCLISSFVIHIFWIIVLHPPNQGLDLRIIGGQEKALSREEGIRKYCLKRKVMSPWALRPWKDGKRHIKPFWAQQVIRINPVKSRIG